MFSGRILKRPGYSDCEAVTYILVGTEPRLAVSGRDNLPHLAECLTPNRGSSHSPPRVALDPSSTYWRQNQGRSLQRSGNNLNKMSNDGQSWMYWPQNLEKSLQNKVEIIRRRSLAV